MHISCMNNYNMQANNHNSFWCKKISWIIIIKHFHKRIPTSGVLKKTSSFLFTNVTSPWNLAIFLMESSREKLWVRRRVFMGSDYGRWNFWTFHNFFAGFVLQGRCLPATYCTEYYGFKRMKKEQGLLIQLKFFLDAARIEPMTSRWKTST
jgi:hypothetical protein